MIVGGEKQRRSADGLCDACLWRGGSCAVRKDAVDAVPECRCLSRRDRATERPGKWLGWMPSQVGKSTCQTDLRPRCREEWFVARRVQCTLTQTLALYHSSRLSLCLRMYGQLEVGVGEKLSGAAVGPSM